MARFAGKALRVLLQKQLEEREVFLVAMAAGREELRLRGREELRLHEFDPEQGGLDFYLLDGLVAAYEISPQCVVVKTKEGREIRITAQRDLSTGEYVSEYERRGSVNSDGNTYQVWMQTPVYQACTADDLGACLDAAVVEVNRVHVY
jgi:hypothetical protein